MNAIEHLKSFSASSRSVTSACLVKCQKLVAQIQKAKDSVISEYRGKVAAREHLLRLAVTEAEALAWQTEYPQLLFPALAEEKAHAVVAWHSRQQAIQSGRSQHAFAA